MKNNSVYTLGICNDETSSACLFVDGRLISAASEERFSRKKLDDAFPQNAINFVLANSSISFSDLTHIAYSWAKHFDQDLLLKYINRSSLALQNGTESHHIFLERIKWDIQRDTAGRDKYNAWLLNQDLQNIVVQEFYHHESHAASAALLSPFNDGIVLTSDGRGDFESTTIWKFDRKEKNCITNHQKT